MSINKNILMWDEFNRKNIPETEQKCLRSNSIRVRKREKIIKKEREEEKKREKERHR